MAAIVALATLEIAYAVDGAAPRAARCRSPSASTRVTFLSPLHALALIAAGAMLGAMGGLLARGRAQA